MADKVLLVKFGEIAMRGDNQYIFINRLILAIRRNLDPVGNYYVVREPGRLIVEDRGGEMDYDLVIPRVEPIFGLVALCPGIRLQEMSMDAIKEEALRHMQELYGDKPMTFKVNARRSNKGFGVASMQIAADVGEYILDHMPNMTVNVKTRRSALRQFRQGRFSAFRRYRQPRCHMDDGKTWCGSGRRILPQPSVYK